MWWKWPQQRSHSTFWPWSKSLTHNAVEREPQSNISDEWLQSESDRNHSSVTEPNSDHIQHVRTEQKQYMCTVCGKSFRIRTNLKLHMKIHTGGKPYCCQYCKKAHLICVEASPSAHGAKPYECCLYGKRFNVSTTLKVHHRIHTGEKPYKCKTCDKAFTTSSNLKKHMALYSKVADGRQDRSCHCMKNVTGNHNEMV